MKKVKVFTTSTCPYCKMEKEFLDAKGIKYEVEVVDHDVAKAQELMAASGQLGVPFTVITQEDGRESTVLGFDEAEIAKQLGLS
jgi:glutaredoxin